MEQLETMLGAVKQKQSTVEKRCFHCNRKGHRSLQCHFKKKKGRSEKAGATTETRVNNTKTKCSHCSKPGHVESSCWKKYPHKVPSKSSTKASGVFLNKELHVCNININETYCITENIENTHYCIPIIKDRQWVDLGYHIIDNRQMKELAASHVEDQQWSVQAEANNSKWDPQEMGPSIQTNRVVI
jgi:hypothetical protein